MDTVAKDRDKNNNQKQPTTTNDTGLVSTRFGPVGIADFPQTNPAQLQWSRVKVWSARDAEFLVVPRMTCRIPPQGRHGCGVDSLRPRETEEGRPPRGAALSGAYPRRQGPRTSHRSEDTESAPRQKRFEYAPLPTCCVRDRWSRRRHQGWVERRK